MASLGLFAINTTALHATPAFRRRRSTAVSRPRPSFLCQNRLPSEPPVGGGGGGGEGGGGGKKRAWWATLAERLHGDVVKAGMAVQGRLCQFQTFSGTNDFGHHNPIANQFHLIGELCAQFKCSTKLDFSRHT